MGRMSNFDQDVKKCDQKGASRGWRWSIKAENVSFVTLLSLVRPMKYSIYSWSFAAVREVGWLAFAGMIYFAAVASTALFNYLNCIKKAKLL